RPCEAHRTLDADGREPRAAQDEVRTLRRHGPRRVRRGSRHLLAGAGRRRRTRHAREVGTRAMTLDARALDLVVAAVVAWLALGALGLVRPRHLVFISRYLFPASAAVGLALAIVAMAAIAAPAQALILPLGLPDLPFHLRL